MSDATGEGAALPPGTTRLFLPLHGGVELLIAVDAALVASVDLHKVTLEGGRGNLAVLTDRYGSAAVADGEEVYVRVVDLAAAKERWSLLAASAAAGQTAADPLIEPAEDGTGFTVRLPDGDSVAVMLGEDGAVDSRPLTGASA